MSKKKSSKYPIPSKVKVGGFTYDVRDVDVVIINGETCYAGSCDHNNNRIEILDCMPTHKKLDTFLHELLHAVFYEAGFKEHEEDMIVRLGNVLYQVVTDNKWDVGGANE